jgi:hypothetical protein
VPGAPVGYLHLARGFDFEIQLNGDVLPDAQHQRPGVGQCGDDNWCEVRPAWVAQLDFREHVSHQGSLRPMTPQL